MAEQYYSVVTDVGAAKIAQATTITRRVNITHFAVGDGNGAYYTPTTDMTALKNEKWRGQVNAFRLSAENPNIIIVDGIIPSNVGGFLIREIGLFDSYGDMIAICNTPDTEKAAIDNGVVHEMMVSMEIAVLNTDALELTIDPTVVYATKQYVDDVFRSLGYVLGIENGVPYVEEI